jgi:hypothetical protein
LRAREREGEICLKSNAYSFAWLKYLQCPYKYGL